MKIAVGIDFSPDSELAAQQAVEIARHVGGDVVLIHAALTVELPALGAGGEAWRHPSMDRLRACIAEEQQRDRERLAALRERLSGQGPVISHVLAEGYAEEAICSAADELGADLVVVGTHGRTGLRWFFLGSIAQHVVRLAREDVIVARRAVVGRGGFHRTLVAYDFSPASERALDRAIELSAPGAEIHVVHFHCLRSLVGWSQASRSLASEMDRHFGRELGNEGEKVLEPRRSARGPTLVFEVVHGSPVPGVVHWLERHNFDLAALGSHGRRGFRRAVLGSVAEAVIRRAPCSVLVAHAADATRREARGDASAR
jgi:nucleotide-binding universal stress UspA family protein